MIAYENDDAVLEMSRLYREAFARIAAKRAALQLGECFVGLQAGEALTGPVEGASGTTAFLTRCPSLGFQLAA